MTIPLVKISANFMPRAMDALNSAAERNRESRTDALNRAAQLYDLITLETSKGGRLLIESPDGSIKVLTLL